jgi:putative endonuclease
LDLGTWGESHATDFLVKKGYVILAKNYRFKKAEVDLIVQKDDCIIAVEVKTRSTSNVATPTHAVNKTKQKLLISAINHFIESKKAPVEVRMDVISIVKTNDQIRVDHIENAFYPFI